MPDGQQYLLTDAIADYRLEWADSRPSAESIAARLNHVLDFLESPASANGIATSCAEAAGAPFVVRFRAWSKTRPVVWRNKGGEVTVSRPRSPATTEESVLQLCAALNHACAADPPRSQARPLFQPLPRSHVSNKRKVRCDEAVLADMLAYAKDNRRRRALHAFLVASICTIARPDSVVDISTDPTRLQWRPGDKLLDLNPSGRIQTKKFRPIVPVLDPLDAWLRDTLDLSLIDKQAEDARDRTGGWLVNFYGRPVQDVHAAWISMLKALNLPQQREWMPYVIRHSVATLARGRGADKWDLQGMMGHRDRSQTEVYAVSLYPTAFRALSEVLAEIERRAPGALYRSNTGAASNVIMLGAQKMT